MPNSYFQFKEFTVHQEKTAMKVCTDACIFGAWVALQIQKSKLQSQSILDIGAGTGLLSLMLSQKTSAQIDAVEIEEAAAKQAAQNFLASRWKDRLQLHHLSIQHFTKTSEKKYDVILSNPPFYLNSLLSPDDNKTTAKHSTGLSYNDLLTAVLDTLKDDGSFYLLLPYEEFKIFKNKALKEGLFIYHQLDIKHSAKHNIFRSIGQFSKLPSIETNSELCIKKGDKYTSEVIQLLKDYYLHL